MGFGLHAPLSRLMFPFNSWCARHLQRRQLMVLNYHRVGTPDQIFPGSATLAECDLSNFEAQMEWLSEHATPIDVQTALLILDGCIPAPHRPVLVTFDDGYRDDLQRLRPCCERLGIRPLVFLPTGFVGTRRWFWWDRIAVCLHRTACDKVVCGTQVLPLGTPATRQHAEIVLSQQVERLPNAQREPFIVELEGQLGVPSTAEGEQSAVVSWDEVRELHASFDFGAHTVSHFTLSMLSSDELRRELADSKSTIEEQLGVPCTAMAIPGGRAKDYTPAALQAAGEIGFRTIFSSEDTLRSPIAMDSSSWLVDRVCLFGLTVPGLAAKLTWPTIFVPVWSELVRERLAALRRMVELHRVR